MKKLISILLVFTIALGSTSICYGATSNTVSASKIKSAGNKSLTYLKDKQKSILKSNKKAKYTILASYYPGKSKKKVTKELANCGFTYDNSLVALAFIAAGDKKRAAYILDGFKYALSHDRSGEVKIRNAYRKGTLADKKYGALLPGFWAGYWSEDAYQVGTNLGNTSWAAIAMLQYNKKFKTTKYLKSARKAMDYVLKKCKTDKHPGLSSGYDGWPENGSYDVQRYKYKSTECNLDAAVAFKRLYQVTKVKKYKTAYEDCLEFVNSMYIPTEKRYVVGTTTDGITKNTNNTFTDCIAWPILALDEEYIDKEALTESIKNMTTEGGLPFVCLGIPSDRAFESKGGIWYEGCIFGSMALKKAGYDEEANAIMTKVLAGQAKKGAFTSANKSLFADNTWRYGCKDYHIAPTAWMVMYAKNFNPFRFN